jgi:uncharacterized RDD family membrane protein YckC
MSDERRNLPGRMIDAFLGSVVPPVVHAVDFDDVTDRLDVNDLLERVDVNGLVARVDLDRALGRLDMNGLLDRVDTNALLDRIDTNALLDRIDPNALIDKIDPNALIDKIDPNVLIERVDLNAVINRVDLNAVIERVDLNAVIDRVDLNTVIERVDLDAVLERVDVNKIVERTELKAIIARSTTGIFSEVLDVVRTRIVTIDSAVQGTARRIIRRDDRSVGPGTPSDPENRPKIWGIPARKRAVALQGQYAGSVSRFLGFLMDQVLIGVLYGIGTWMVLTALSVVAGENVSLKDHPLAAIVSFLLWELVYFAGQLALAGRTLGMALLGLLVVKKNGATIGSRTAVVRTLVLPLSFLFFGVGFWIGLFRRDRRELHDLIAGSAVLYAWDAETAQLRAETLSVEVEEPEPPAAPQPLAEPVGPAPDAPVGDLVA